MSGSHGEWISDDKVKTNINNTYSKQQQQKKSLYKKILYNNTKNNSKALLKNEIAEGMFLFQIHVSHDVITRFLEIWDALRDLVLFLQFKKHEKHPRSSATSSKVAGFSLVSLQLQYY